MLRSGVDLHQPRPGHFAKLFGNIPLHGAGLELEAAHVETLPIHEPALVPHPASLAVRSGCPGLPAPARVVHRHGDQDHQEEEEAEDDHVHDLGDLQQLEVVIRVGFHVFNFLDGLGHSGPFAVIVLQLVCIIIAFCLIFLNVKIVTMNISVPVCRHLIVNRHLISGNVLILYSIGGGVVSRNFTIVLNPNQQSI